MYNTQKLTVPIQNIQQITAVTHLPIKKKKKEGMKNSHQR